MDEAILLIVLVLMVFFLGVYCMMLYGRHTPYFLKPCPKCGCDEWEDKIVRDGSMYSEGWHCKECNHYSGRYTGTLHDYGGM